MPSQSPANTVLGVTLMTLAMLTIPMVDGIAKHLGATHSPLYVSWARYVAACVVVLPFAWYSHGRQCMPQGALGPHLLRTVFLVVGMTCYFIAIVRVPMASAASAYFIGPILAMALAVVWLRESLTWQKALSLVLGFIGTLIVLRPTAGIQPGLVWALASGGCIAFYMIATRRAVQQSDPLRTLVFQCVVGAMLLTPQAAWTWSWPQASQLWIFLAMGVLSAVSHFLSISALRYAEASLLAPLIYVELLGATLIGYFAFGEIPGSNIWLGAAAIVAGGLLLTFWGSGPAAGRARE